MSPVGQSFGLRGGWPRLRSHCTRSSGHFHVPDFKQVGNANSPASQLPVARAAFLQGQEGGNGCGGCTGERGLAGMLAAPHHPGCSSLFHLPLCSQSLLLPETSWPPKVAGQLTRNRPSNFSLPLHSLVLARLATTKEGRASQQRRDHLYSLLSTLPGVIREVLLEPLSPILDCDSQVVALLSQQQVLGLKRRQYS